jgi:FkbM family methyltransferase
MRHPSPQHRSTADFGVLKQIFKKRDYALDRHRRGSDIVQEYERIGQAGRRALIVDAGANIGASAVWFSKAFPQAQIAAFEPDHENCQLLTRNTADLNVEVHHAAVSSADGFVDLADPGIGEWGYQTQVNASGSIKSVGLNHFVAQKMDAGFDPLIAKIDIEGAEGELFSQHTDWVSKFPLIIIELHDWLRPGQGTSHSFLRTIAPLNRDFVYSGENIFSFRNELLPPAE